MASSRETKAVNVVDDFESAFQNCISLLTAQEHFNVQNSEETKGGVENSVQKFLESARQMDSFFLTKRLSLSVAKPELVLNEDITELKNELDRKEKLIEKHHEKLQKWQGLLRSNQPVAPPANPYQAAGTSHPTNMPQGPAMGPSMGGPMPSQAMMAQQPSNIPQVTVKQKQTTNVGMSRAIR